MLSFDKNGFLTPYEVIPASMELLESEFVDSFESELRKKHFDKLSKYLEALKSVVKEEITIWVNGSYVTKKLNPKDIDVVVFIHWKIVEANIKELKSFTRPEVLANYGVDSYLVRVYEKGHQLNVITHSDRIHWLYDFSRTQPNRRGKTFQKGFLEIKY